MFAAKTLIAAAAALALAGQATAYSMPACWSTCFATYNVTSESALCAAPIKTEVASCIVSGCAAANATASGTEYASWLCTYCHDTSAACKSSNSSSSASPVSVPSTMSMMYTATAPLATAPAATGSGVPMPYGNGTNTATYSAAATTGGMKTSATSSPSGTVAPYTGGASTMGAAGGMVLLIGSVAAGLLL